MRTAVLFFLMLSAGTGFSQMYFGAEVGPDSFAGGPGDKKEVKPEIQPFAKALSVYFSSSTWETVGISTFTPEKTMTEYMYRGYYKLELINLIIMAERSGKRFKELTAERDKGKSFSDIAEKLKMDFREIYAEAADARKKIELIVPSVDISTASSAVSADVKVSTK